jgi:prepilin-type N-terminal cleavage/methylation domain-containing protein/prepilin-type processing-associated H-X9-DG protein
VNRKGLSFFSGARARTLRQGFTLVELLVVIGIIALLISILLPSLSAAREQARTTKCMSNLRSIHQAMTAYAAEQKGYLVPCDVEDTVTPPDPTNGYAINESWATILVCMGYLKTPVGVMATVNGGDHVLKCPSGILEDSQTGFSNIASGRPNSRLDMLGAMGAQHISKTLEPGRVIYCWYGANGVAEPNSAQYVPMWRAPTHDSKMVRQMSNVKNGSSLVILYDGLSTVHMITGNANRLNARHGTSARHKQTNLLFLDGHVETYFTADLPGGTDDANQPGGAGTVYGLANLANYPYPQWRTDQH